MATATPAIATNFRRKEFIFDSTGGGWLMTTKVPGSPSLIGSKLDNPAGCESKPRCDCFSSFLPTPAAAQAGAARQDPELEPVLQIVGRRRRRWPIRRVKFAAELSWWVVTNGTLASAMAS
jgi:hypothetical protein